MALMESGFFGRVARYFRDADEEARARNTIAAIVIGNIPFYPLYVGWFVGWRAWPTFLAFLSLPFFLVVPLANRAGARLGRWALVFAGLVDTGLCTQGLGSATGVELYYIAIALLSLVLYRNETVGWRALMLGLTVAVFLLGRLLGGSFVAYSAAEQTALLKMHAVSAGLLCLVIVILRWRFGRQGQALATR